uniref:Major facilitator superfamily (MFS) profile domain-containing protein n=1 Tax=Aegilops tauschii subsp. strangulata TaxID=200361 RepID=A0A453PU12_AEGTS
MAVAFLILLLLLFPVSHPCNNLQYSVFGSIITVGAMIGAVVSGQIADVAGRKGVCLLVYASQNARLNLQTV